MIKSIAFVIFLFIATAQAQTFTWTPKQIKWGETISSVNFINGARIQVLSSNRGSKTLYAKKSTTDTEQATDISDDLVFILKAFPNQDKAVAALVSSSCSGTICGWQDMKLAYISNGTFFLHPIASNSNANSQLKLIIKNNQLKEAKFTDLTEGPVDAYGDPITTARTLINEKGFVVDEFMPEFYELIGEHPNAFFSHKQARAKFAEAIGLNQFREFRNYLSGPGFSQLAAGRYVVFNGCMAHSCNNNRGVVIFDAVTRDTWALRVDANTKEYYFQSTLPLTKPILAAASPAIKIDLQLDVINGELKVAPP